MEAVILWVRMEALVAPHSTKPGRGRRSLQTLCEERHRLLKAGTIVDATIIGAPSSTENATQATDAAMQQARKAIQWYVGNRLHVGTARRGLVHTLTTTPAAAADSTQLPDLLHGEETTLATKRTTVPVIDPLGSERRALSGEQARASHAVLGHDQRQPLTHAATDHHNGHESRVFTDYLSTVRDHLCRAS